MNKEPAIDRMSSTELVDLFKRQRENTRRLALSTAKERKDKLKRMLVYLLRHAGKAEQAVYLDLKKPAHEARISEILTLTTELRYHIKHIDRWLKPQQVSNPLFALGTQNYIQYEPKGTSLIISPWNYPINLALKPLIYAISAGCTAFIKPSEYAPNSAAFVRELVRNVFTMDEVSVVEGDKEVAEELLELPFDHIFFTGSPQTGKKVMAAASKHLSSVTLELGGKSPAVIDNTADLAATARKIVWAKCINSGQSCIAPDYLLVQRDVLDRCIVALKNSIQEMFNPEGESIRRSTDYGRIINGNHFERLRGLYQDAIENGANVEAGGNFDEADLFIEPTLLTDISLSMRLMKEEIFGPLLPILPFDTISEAIDIIRSIEKPLGVYIHSRDSGNIEQILRQTSSGSVLINEVLMQSQHPEIPFGGIGPSGAGRSNGFYGFTEFSNPKGVIERKVGSLKFLYPPYTERTQKLLGWIQRFL